MKALLAGLALFFGEFFIIGAELWAAKYFGSSPNPGKVFLISLGISMVACTLLVYGYTYGYQAFKNIWIITTISVSGILIVEPIAAWLLFREIPTLGAGIAFLLAIIGVFLTLVLK